MKTRTLTLLLALACAGAWPAAQAQAVAAAASAPAPIKSKPRALTPAEKRDSATAPGDMRPVDPVIPQINVPLGRTAPPPLRSKAEALRQRQAASAGGIDDSVARCKAGESKAAREECLARLKKAGKAP